MFSNAKIKTKLILLMFLLSILLISIGSLGVYGMRGINNSLRTIYDDRLIPTGQLANINDLMQVSIRDLQLASWHDPRLEVSKLHDHPLSMHTNEVEKNIAIISKIWQAYMATYLTPEEKNLAEEFSKKRAHFVNEGLLPALKLFNAARYDEGNHILMTKAMPAYKEAKAAAEKLLALQLSIGKEEYDASRAEFKRDMAITGGSIIVGLLIAWLFGIALIRAISKALDQANQIAGNIAKGDLTSHIEIHTRDEIGQLLESMKQMQDNLHRIVAQVRTGTDTIATASAQITSGNMDLSSRTEQQASSLEETASSMEELTSTVRQNAENANQANQLAATASTVAVQGGEVVHQVVETMNAINESSKKMSDIIGVIDGIAFQTNILALNAAVEAARAGEQGRGFAVVATEVRNLAQRSAAAAREIKSLIDDSVGKVEQGSRLVDQAGNTMSEVVNSIQRVTDIMSEITAASREQSEGIEQVNQAVVQMDQVTQQNAALVEEAAAAAESLRDQASNLVTVVSVFNLGQGASQQVVAKPALKPLTTKMTSSTPPKPPVKRTPAPQLEASSAPQNKPKQNEDWEEF